MWSRIAGGAIGVVPLAIAALSAPSMAQELRWKVNGGSTYDWLGWSARFGGDSDADGRRELLVGALGVDCNGANAGESLVLRGWDGLELQSICGVADGSWGFAVDGDLDVDQDGVVDVLTSSVVDSRGNWGAGAYAIYSGADGALLREELGTTFGEKLGWSLTSLVDLDGDGSRDYAVASPQHDTPHVTVYSGVSGQILFTLAPSPPDPGFGLSLADSGDVNTDGLTDVIVGNPNAAGENCCDPGGVWVFSGADGSVLLHLEGERDGSRFGESVDGIGDVDGDGHADFIVGAPLWQGNVDGPRGRAYVYSGADGTLLYRHDGFPSNGMLGVVVAGLGDLNRDGVPDYAACDPYDGTGFGCAAYSAVHVYSGRNGLRLYHFDRSNAGDLTEVDSLDGGADVDGDGHIEIAIGTSYDDEKGSGSGAVHVFSMKDFYCDAEPKQECAGDDVAIRLAETVPGNPVGLALVGIDGTPWFTFLVIAPADATGRFEVSGTIPAGMSGHYVDFRAFAIGFSGEIVASAVERLTIE